MRILNLARRRRIAGLAAAALLWAGVAAAEAAPAAGHETAAERAREAVAALMEAAELAGVCAAVAVDGEVVWAEGFGFADLEKQVAVTPQTRFRLGSVSKLFTAAVAARLAESGRLDLDAPIQRYLPDYAQPAAGAVPGADGGGGDAPDGAAPEGAAPENAPPPPPITARLLAGHLGGIRHYLRKDFVPQNIDFQHYDSVAESLVIFRDDPLVAPPGERYNYTTFGYTLLAALLEGAAGSDFLTLLRDEVTAPLGLDATVADQPRPIIPHRTGFYERVDDGVINASYVDPSYKWAGGGLLSTASDLARFAAAHRRAGYLSADTLETLFTPQRTAAGEETGVGIGWRIGTDPATGEAIAHHAGNINGGRAAVVLFRDAGVAAAVLSNLGNLPPAAQETAAALGQLFLPAASHPDGDAGRQNLAGSYTYLVESEERSEQGELELTAAGGGFRGWMSTPTWMNDFAGRLGLPPAERLPIVHVDPAGAAVLATPAGLLGLRLEPTAEGLAGTFAWIGREGTVTATRRTSNEAPAGAEKKAPDRAGGGHQDEETGDAAPAAL